MQNETREQRLEQAVRGLVDTLAVTHAFLQVLDDRLDIFGGKDPEQATRLTAIIARCQILTLLDLPEWSPVTLSEGVKDVNARTEIRDTAGYKYLKSAFYRSLASGRQNQSSE